MNKQQCLICMSPIEGEGIKVLGEWRTGVKGWLHKECLERNINQLLSEKPEYMEYLQRILSYEERTDHIWKWSDVGVPAQRLNILVSKFIITIIVNTRSATKYCLVDRGVVKETLSLLEEPEEKTEISEEVPEDLFDIITGYDDIKELIRNNLGKPQVAFAFFGGPATGKTVFLLELERLGGKYIDGSRLSASALGQILAENPKFILIDEVHNLKDASVFGMLNTVIEEGRLVETIAGKIKDMNLQTQVFIAGITDRNLPKDFLSRFVIFHFHPYSAEEFVKVVKELLTKRAQCPDIEIAGYIGERAYELDGGIRLARSIYRLCETKLTKENIDKTIEILKKYKK